MANVGVEPTRKIDSSAGGLKRELVVAIMHRLAVVELGNLNGVPGGCEVSLGLRH